MIRLLCLILIVAFVASDELKCERFERVGRNHVMKRICLFEDPVGGNCSFVNLHAAYPDCCERKCQGERSYHGSKIMVSSIQNVPHTAKIQDGKLIARSIMKSIKSFDFSDLSDLSEILQVDWS